MASPRSAPTLRVGNYTAPIDTTGMDADAKTAVGAGPPIAPTNPIQAAFQKWFGAKPKSMPTAAHKSAAVHRTSDIPTGADKKAGYDLVDSMLKKAPPTQ